HTKAYWTAVAEEVRQLLAKMGFRSLPEITGRTDLLSRRTDLTGRIAKVDVSRFLRPDMALARLGESFTQTHGPAGLCHADPNPLNVRILAATQDAIEYGQDASLLFKVKNADRSVGATAAGRIARLYGREGMPNQKKIKLRFEGEAGQ